MGLHTRDGKSLSSGYPVGGRTDRPRDLDDSTILDVDAHGNICSITIEHASLRASAPHFWYEEVAA
jgi:uncharacterized protein YuzE